MAQGEFWVERQNWARWPRTLMMHHVSGEVRRYVPAWSDRPNEMCREENARLRKKVENQAQNIRGLLKR